MAYCQVVNALREETNLFRVLALSATPGENFQAVQNVVDNLVRELFPAHAHPRS